MSELTRPNVEDLLSENQDNEGMSLDEEEALLNWVHSIESQLQKVTAERDRLREALTPSAETKSIHIGEYSFNREIFYSEDEDPFILSIDVPWTTVKDIMKKIREGALND